MTRRLIAAAALATSTNVDVRAAASRQRPRNTLRAAAWVACAVIVAAQTGVFPVALQAEPSALGAPLAAGCASAIGVAAVLALLRLSSVRLAALVAALPLISTPTLAWLTVHESALVAAQAAAGALAAALFATLLVAIACALCRQRAGAVRIPVLPRRALLTIAVAGAVSGAIVYGRAWLPPAACGALAGLPVIGAMTLLHVALTGGRGALASALPGYLRGGLASVTFFGSLALALPALPPAMAWLAALGFGALALNAATLHRPAVTDAATRPRLLSADAATAFARAR